MPANRLRAPRLAIGFCNRLRPGAERLAGGQQVSLRGRIMPGKISSCAATAPPMNFRRPHQCREAVLHAGRRSGATGRVLSPRPRHDGAGRRADAVLAQVTKLLGLAIGYGLENDVRDAYVFLMNAMSPATASICSASAAAPTRSRGGLAAAMYGLIPGQRPARALRNPDADRDQQARKRSNKKAEKPKLDQKPAIRSQAISISPTRSRRRSPAATASRISSACGTR